MWKRFARSEDGAVMVEASIAMTMLLMLTLGFVDFGNAFYQWNGASKAVQVGARLASISDPVATALLTAAPSSIPGAPVEKNAYGPFICTYTGCAVGGAVSGFDSAAFNRIFRGDTTGTNDACPAPTGSQRPGMCHFFPFLKRENVVITYSATGLGYQGRVDGPVPTITVSLENVDFQFFFLQGLMNFANITMPPMLSTVTGEDMKYSGS